MKLTKATLIKIIKEELSELEIPSIDVSEEPTLSSVDIIHRIKEIVDMAVLDKGLGFRPGSGEHYIKQISALLGN
jgi:hypothetical protein|tara:strand:- start:418 stop:642 length:225 start_codon:yes stop_codon:yes gene_type:complete